MTVLEGYSGSHPKERKPTGTGWFPAAASFPVQELEQGRVAVIAGAGVSAALLHIPDDKDQKEHARLKRTAGSWPGLLEEIADRLHRHMFPHAESRALYVGLHHMLWEVIYMVSRMWRV